MSPSGIVNVVPLGTNSWLDVLYVNTSGGPPAVASNNSITGAAACAIEIADIRLTVGGAVKLKTLIEPANVINHVDPALTLCAWRMSFCGVGAPLVTAVAFAVRPIGQLDGGTRVSTPTVPIEFGNETCPATTGGGEKLAAFAMTHDAHTAAPPVCGIDCAPPHPATSSASNAGNRLKCGICDDLEIERVAESD